jgi:hypothetical protein
VRRRRRLRFGAERPRGARLLRREGVEGHLASIITVCRRQDTCLPRQRRAHALRRTPEYPRPDQVAVDGSQLPAPLHHEEAPSLAPAIAMDFRIRPANLPSDRADPRSVSGEIEQALTSEAVSGVPTGPFSVRAVTWPGRRTPGPVGHDGGP